MTQIDKLKDLVRIQSQDGTWNYDPYMHGLYNGLELALATMENREPLFKNPPAKWLYKSRRKISREMKAELSYSRVGLKNV